ncbi:hypothetical protein EA1_04647 [Moraxella catarrhalis O35E]|nr:hypothetical protein EA1_04647 [Moraxella catarrhalis O35E]
MDCKLLNFNKFRLYPAHQMVSGALVFVIDK